MNILQIGTIDKGGGAANISWGLKQFLEQGGNQTSMFVAHKYTCAKNVFKLLKPIHRYFYYLIANDFEFFNTDKILKTEAYKNADIIHCHNLHGWFFNLKTMQKMSKEKPVIWTLHDMWAITPHCAHSYDGKLKNGFFQCPSLNIYPKLYWHNENYLSRKKTDIYRNSNLNIVVPSLWLKKKVIESVLGDKDITLIYNGIDTNIFKSQDKNKTRSELKLPPDKKIILFLADGGKNDLFKGWIYVEKIIKHYERDNSILFLCIGGTGSPDDDCNTNIRYISRINKPELLAKYLTLADILLYPTLADNCPLVILEAMACGLPVVTFDTGGVSELVIHEKNGYIAKYKDENDLIKGIEYLFNLSTEEQEIMIESSILRVRENFSLTIMTNKYLELYNQLLNSNKINNN